MTVGAHDGLAEIDDSGIPSHFLREIQIELLIHDLQDPITIIESGARSLLEKRDKFGALSSRQERALRRVLRGALRGRDMLSTLLEIGRSELGRFTASRFSPTAAIRASLLESLEITNDEILEKLGQSKSEDAEVALLAKVGIVVNTAPNLDGVEITQDASSFTEIVGNLIKNALRFRNQRLEINSCRVEDMLKVVIRDDGPGIPSENHDLIFQPFTQAGAAIAGPRRGYGLGLAGARILARRLGGNISVDSEVSKGARFCLSLPVSLAISSTSHE